MAHEGLFHEPEFAPGTMLPDNDELVPVRRQHAEAPYRRAARRHAAA